MSTVTKPLMLDETGQAIVNAIINLNFKELKDLQKQSAWNYSASSSGPTNCTIDNCYLVLYVRFGNVSGAEITAGGTKKWGCAYAAGTAGTMGCMAFGIYKATATTMTFAGSGNVCYWVDLGPEVA